MFHTLDESLMNQELTVQKINGQELLKRRFLDLGFLPGEKVKCVLSSPFHDPKAYYINGNVIALRNQDAKYIEVSYEGD